MTAELTFWFPMLFVVVYPCDTVLDCTSCGSVFVCVCYKGSILSKGVDSLSWFLAQRLSSTYPTLNYPNYDTLHTHTHTHPFNGPFSRTTRVGRYQKGINNLGFTEARDSVWQWYQLGHMQVCTSLQTDNHASTSPLSFLQAGCPSCCPTNSVKALKAQLRHIM